MEDNRGVDEILNNIDRMLENIEKNLEEMKRARILMGVTTEEEFDRLAKARKTELYVAEQDNLHALISMREVLEDDDDTSGSPRDS